MIRRIVYLIIPVAILAVIGLMAVFNFTSSFPGSKTVIEKLTPPQDLPDVIDQTESFFDDSGSMKGYRGELYIKFLRTIKAHISEKGQYKYHAFSDPDNVIGGDVWQAVEDIGFYNQSNTYFDKVLDSILARVKKDRGISKNFLIITDGIQDVSSVHDYTRIINKISALLDADLFFQVVAVRIPFNGSKFSEAGGAVPFKGDSPLFCYIFSYQYDFGSDLYKKMSSSNMPVEFLGFGNRNIRASVKKFSDPAHNREGSKNAFRRYKDEIPVTYLVSRSGTGGTLLTDIALNVKGINVDNSGFRQKTPEFCGQCMPVDSSGSGKETKPGVAVTTVGVDPAPDANGNMGIEYSLYFKNWDKGSKTLACDITLCNWLPANPPDWVNAWSSDCDNSAECYEGKTPFLTNIINPLLTKSVRQYTFGYAVIRN
ncbi:MAG: VWA domain-containing protein [Nitrospirae bacterium]|nr:VWA domain-containing protein [Nitrospirota bacterium]